MAYEKISYSVDDGGIATLALDDPETRNALSDELLLEMLDALRSARSDDAVRVLVLTSTHEKVFSAGGNLAGFGSDAPTSAKWDATGHFVDVFEALGTLGKPSIVAANGHVLAGSLGIALACDLIIARDGVGFGTPEINVGLFPFMIMALIYRNVPRKKATEMMLLGERLTTEEAREAGIVNRIVPAEEFDAGRRRLGGEAGLEVAAGDEARQGRDLAPARHAADGRARLPARAADDRALDRGRGRGRDGVLREARAEVEGTLMADLRELTDDLHDRREKAKLGGGEEKIQKQHDAGKLTARERIDLLVDEGTFVEMGIHAGPHFSQRSMDGKEAPADGVVTGWGDVDGRPCAIAAYDFTVMAGSMGMTGELKVGRLREMALQKRMPLIWLLDSAGARIQEASGSLFAGSGHLFREEVTMSGVVPMVAAMLGPCAAGHRLHPRALGLRADGRRPGRDGAGRARI